MTGTALSLLLIASIALAVFLGYKTGINTGLFCIIFGYIIGCFVMGLAPKTIIGYWPISTMFVILAVSLFYNVAAANGTLEKLSRTLLYACRKFPSMLPYALFFVAVILSVMGAAYFTVLAFLAPITMLICEESKMDKLTGAMAINCGALAGGNFPTAALGVIFRGLMDEAYANNPDLTPIDSFSSTLTMCGLAIVVSLILITIMRFAIPANRTIGKGVTFAKPEAYDKVQKQTLTLIFVMMAVVLVFPLLKMLLPDVAFISMVAGKIDVGPGGDSLRGNRPVLKAGSPERDHRQDPVEYHHHDRRRRHADRRSRGSRHHRDALRLDRQQRACRPDSAGLQHRSGNHEFLQLHHRRSYAGPVPAGSRSGGCYRPDSRGAVYLYRAGRPEFRHQPLLFRRFPDSGFLRKRRRTQYAV